MRHGPLLAGLAGVPAIVAAAPARAQEPSAFAWWPSQTEFGTVAFEDLWPARGDADYNDLGVRVHLARSALPGGQTTALEYSFQIWTLGATDCGGLALRLAGEDPANLVLEGVIGAPGAVDGAPWAPWPVEAVSDGDGGAVIVVADDVRARLCGGQTGFLNTVQGEPPTSCAPVGLRIGFATPSAAVGTATRAPGDLFWFACGDPGTQIHAPTYPGVPGGPLAADPTRFGTLDDASETGPGADRFYVDALGIPWVLAYSDGVVNLPRERYDIAGVLPGLLDFAAGTGGLDFWHHPEVGVYTFTGAPPPLPRAEFSAAPVRQSCRAIGEAWTGGASPSDGVYPIDPDGGGPIEAFDAWCRFDTVGGWTRVARLDTVTRAYCGGDPAPEHDLRADPYRSAAKVPDAVVQALVAPYGDPQVMYWTGEPGRGEFVRRAIDEAYRTDIRIDRCAGWTCADGSSDATACGGEVAGCGFSGPGTGGDAKKLYMDADYTSHVASLHSGGGFCGLDNRARYGADVYVR